MQIVFVLEKKTESALIGRQQVKHLHVLDVYVAENSQLNNHALSGWICCIMNVLNNFKFDVRQ